MSTPHRDRALQRRSKGRARGTAGNAGAPRAEDVAVAAYYRAERRGFTPGHELDDWLEAERELRPAARRAHARRN